MTRRVVLVLTIVFVLLTNHSRAQSLDLEITALAKRLGRALAAQGVKNVATVDFTDLQGRSTELGRYLSERLSVELSALSAVTVVDRANINRILAEQRLTQEALVHPDGAKKLGQFAGVDVIFVGSVTVLGEIDLTVKAISTESARIIAAGHAVFAKTSDIQRLLGRGISNRTPEGGPTIAAPAPAGRRRGIQSVDLGPIGISLDAVKLLHGGGQRPTSIKITMTLRNLLGHPGLTVAANAEAGVNSQTVKAHFLGKKIRFTLLDDRGTLWAMQSSGLIGLSVVSVGNDEDGYPLRPSEIVRVLRRREEEGVDSYPRSNLFFVFGSTTELPPGLDHVVTMTFAPDEYSRNPQIAPAVFTLQGELVVGRKETDRTNSYFLQSFGFDHVVLKSPLLQLQLP